MEKVIEKITRRFEKQKILWGIGGSKLLSFYGITEEVNDLDIIVSKTSIKEVLAILLELGSATKIPKKEEYLTDSFNCFTIDNTEIDVMSGFIIKHEVGIFEFELKSDLINHIEIDNALVPLTSLEQWYLAYLLMKSREEKIEMIENYFIKTKCIDFNKLASFSKNQLPDQVEKRINQLRNEIQNRD